MRNTHPFISVIIPTYNRASMVIEAVESVLEQTFKDFELIVVDDGSTDHTLSLLEKFGPSLRLCRQENRGVSAARNRGLAEAGGELIAFLDSDDLWLPEKLAVQASYLRTFPQAALCHTEEIWLRRGRRVNPRRRHAKASGKAFAELLRESLISPSAVVIRRAVLEGAGGFDERLPACEDYALWLTLARTHRIHLIDRPLVIKRGGHPDQLSRTLWGLDRFRVQVLRELASDAGLSPEEALEVRLVLEEKCRILAAGCRKRGRAGEAEEYLRLAGETVSCDR
jgi:glycosyltransferase involved in cell wall biosynthesis